MISVLRDFRNLVEAVRSLATALQGLAEIQRDAGPALDRLNKMELSRHQFEAECQGILLKADGKLKAAANAEARERQLKKSYEREQLAPFDPDSEETVAERSQAILPVDAEAGRAERMHPVRMGLASNNKAHALKRKWGVA